METEKRWQEKWARAGLFEAEPVEGREKFYLTAAFPYPNSPQHIGHARTYTIIDAYARYMRIMGKNVLFPMAFHVTGTPIMAMARRIGERDREILDIFTNVYGMNEKKALSLTDPRELVMEFSREIELGMREMGFSIDWRRKFYTFDPEFSSFIKWQFHKLSEAGLITKGKHPVPFCARCGNAVGGHDTKGDVDPEMGEFTALKFRFLDGFMPAATLRPETIYGVTNMWVNPEADYVKAAVDGEIFYVSKEAAGKLAMQDHKVEILSNMKGRELEGKECAAPLTGRKVPVMCSRFVDPSNATGVVMSVPSHAPYDYVALREALGDRADKMLIGIISAKGWGAHPAKEIVEKMGIAGIDDPRLEDATKEIYRDELHHGRMSVPGIEGRGVEEARESVKSMLIEKGDAVIVHEIINGPVKCRCGGDVSVKVLDDQWFINYGNEEWKGKALACLSRMKIVPDNRKKDFEYAIGWLREKACTRATGLGTRFPLDEGKMIEALSDSTIYMAFYTVRHKLTGPLTIGEWDYVMLGKGEGSPQLEELRRHFEYWYPLDSRHSGADLIYNHLPFFVFNHTAVFPEDKWPGQIVVNGFVLMDGQKMSKSLGNILPLRKAVREHGADPIRISVVGGAELGEDTDFNRGMVEGIGSRLKFIREVCRNTLESPGNDVERWLEARFLRYARDAMKGYAEIEMRGIVNDLLYKFTGDLKWCIKRGGRPPRGVMLKWAVVFSPIAPHFCDGLWEALGGEGFATMQVMGDGELEGAEMPELEESERIIEQTVRDIAEIEKLIGKKAVRATIFIADDFKRDVFRAVGDSRNANDAIRTAMDNEGIRARGKEALPLIKSAIKWKMPVVMGADEEMRVIGGAAKFIGDECGLEVFVEHERDAGGDMAVKAARALPGKPSIILE